MFQGWRYLTVLDPGGENGIVVWVVSAAVLFSGNGYAPMKDVKMAQVSTHMSPRPDKIGIQSNWGFRGFGVLVFYIHSAPLGLQKRENGADSLLLYTLRSAGARRLDVLLSIDISLRWSERQRSSGLIES